MPDKRALSAAVLVFMMAVLVGGWSYLFTEIESAVSESSDLHQMPGDDVISSELSESRPAEDTKELAVPLNADWKLKMVTFNIRHGQGLDDVVSLDRIASVLRRLDADVIALQEVDKNFGFRSDWEDQAQHLAEKLDMEVAFGPALRTLPLLGKGVGYYGNAILSRFPIKAIVNQVVDAPGFEENRAFIHGVIATPVGHLNFISTHLGLEKRHRIKHVQQLMNYVKGLNGPVVIAGDFNSKSDSEELGFVRQSGFRDAAAEVGKDLPTLIGAGNARIDYILVSPEVSVVDVETVDSDASDHRPVAGLLIFSGSLAASLTS